MKQLIISNSFSYEKAAVLLDGSLDSFFYENNNDDSCLGNIYKAKVVDILPGMQAAFIDIGLQKNAYLYIDELLSYKTISEKNLNKKETYNINDVIKKGEELMVQVIREPIGEKYISVTTDIAIVGKHLIIVPKHKKVSISKKIKNNLIKKRLLEIGSKIIHDNYGIVMRTSAIDIPEQILEEEYNVLLKNYKKIELEFGYSYAPKLLKKSDSLIERLFIEHVNDSVDEIYVENEEVKDIINKLLLKHYGKTTGVKVIDSYSNLFEIFNIEKQIDELNNRKIELDNGGSIIIDSTEALTVIDVNSGKFVGTGTKQDETSLEMNLEALKEIARQIRLRNISGIIIIDFIDFRENNYSDILISKAKELLKNDKARTKVLGMTKLNLMEITRNRKQENFYDSMNESCKYCNGSGKVASALQIMFKIENILKKLSANTSCNFVSLKCNEQIYDKINNELKKDISLIEEKSKISISFIKDKNVINNKIEIEKMGKKA